MTFSATKNRASKNFRSIYSDTLNDMQSGCYTLYPVTGVGGWNAFLNNYAVAIRPDAFYNPNTIMTARRPMKITTSGTYTVTASSDDDMTLKIGSYTYNVTFGSHGCSYCSPFTTNITLNAGIHLIEATVNNGPGGNQGIALTIVNTSTSEEVFNFRNRLSCPSSLDGTPGTPSYAQLYAASAGSYWGTSATFLNTNGVWFGPPVAASLYPDTWLSVNRSVTIPSTGTYTFRLSVDNRMYVYVDGILVAGLNDNYYSYNDYSVNLTAGTKLITINARNDNNGATIWNDNPAAFALQILNGSGTVIYNLRDYLTV